ncbi:MAG: hypothetical protein AAF414_15385 [Pseudomonadota bacterium]
MKFSRFWLLLPHALSCVFFAVAFGWMAIVQTNRSLPDLSLAIAGYIALVVAVLASVIAAWQILAKPARRHLWPWLLVHIGALMVCLALGSEWFAHHLV